MEVSGPASADDIAARESEPTAPPVGTTWQAQIAHVGQLEAAANFARINWGPSDNHPHDLGTDLWVQVRDAKGEDLGCLVGVQVRTGDSYFEKFDRLNGQSGWWHEGLDARHVRHWLQHHDNHLLVLHDHHTRISYWAHINRKSAVSTGVRFKIFVPADQTIDEAHLEDLISVALAGPELRRVVERIPRMEPRNIEPHQRLRYALVAPRLIAPRLLSDSSEIITAEQGVALVMQGRLRDLERFAEENESVPNPKRVSSDANWVWQFVAAAWNWVTINETDLLIAVFGSVPDTNSKTASGLLLCCALLRAGKLREALKVLDGLVESNLEAIDLGWTLVQRARVMAEAGDVNRSRADAEHALGLLEGLDDEAAKAFAAAAQWHLFSLDPLRAGFDSALGTDSNDSMQWRVGEVSSGLSMAQIAAFRSWAEPNSTALVRMDWVSASLFAAELNADLVGDHSDWKARAALKARHQLMQAADSHDEANELLEGLESLRICGDFQSLESSAKRIHQVGPIDPLSEAVGNVPLNDWTHTTAQANFQLLAAAGDLLEIEEATKLLRWCAELAEGDTTDFADKVRPWFWVEYLAIRAVSCLLPAADDCAHGEVVELISRLIGRNTTIPAVEIDSVFDSLDYERVIPATRESLWEIAQRNGGPVGTAALRWFAANSHKLALAEAANRAASRDLEALPAILSADISRFDSNTVERLIEWFDAMVQDRLSAAREHRYAFGGYDGAHLLVKFNILFPQMGRWDTILELLSEPLVDSRTKRNSCALIAVHATDIPSEIRSEFAQDIDAITRAAAVFGDEPGIGGISTMLKSGFGTIGIELATVEAAQLASGSRRDREDAAFLIGSGLCPAIQPILAALSADRSFSVRRAVATATGRLVSTSPSSMTTSLAFKLANDNGSGLPAALLDGVLLAGQQTPESAEISKFLRRHPSAQIRRMAERLT